MNHLLVEHVKLLRSHHMMVVHYMKDVRLLRSLRMKGVMLKLKKNFGMERGMRHRQKLRMKDVMMHHMMGVLNMMKMS